MKILKTRLESVLERQKNGWDGQDWCNKSLIWATGRRNRGQKDPPKACEGNWLGNNSSAPGHGEG